MITPSHNPPRDGGFKYNTPNGGPADTDVTGWIQDRANQLLRAGNRDVKRMPYEEAICSHHHARRISSVLTWMILLQGDRYGRDSRGRELRIGVDPLGGPRRPTGSQSPTPMGWT